MLHKLPALILFFSLFSCEPAEKEFNTEETMLSKEIQLRLSELKPLADSLATLGLQPEAIHQKFQDLLLMSKDVENLQASVNSSNHYIADLCAQHQLNISAIQELNTNQSLSEISYHLKQNELTILNQILLQKMNKSVNLESAR